METPMVQIKRQAPTWTVEVDGKARFSGLWRRSSAEKLAASVPTETAEQGNWWPRRVVS